MTKAVGLLLSGICGSGRNDWLVDFDCESQRAVDYFTPRQPSSSRGLDAFIPSPHGEHAAETDMSLRTVQLNRLTPQGSALPFQVWTDNTWFGSTKRFTLIPPLKE
ncbi:MAG: hypothetical protein ACYCT2_06380 [Thermoplasmataceae archaeon]